MARYKLINGERVAYTAEEEAARDAEEAAAKAEIDANGYKEDRRYLYPPLTDFADAMYWNSKGDSTKLKAYYAACEKVKTDNPKPS
jgi:chlorite dismutase